MLEVSDIHVNYGPLAALRGVSVRVDEGEVVCVIGPNGAGKSTTLGAIAGGVKPHRGSIKLFGRELIGLRPDQIARLGVVLVPEGRRIFGTLTVLENLYLGSYVRWRDRAVEADLEEVLRHFPALAERRAYPATRLSGGEQQMLAVARAIMMRPRLMLIDEPSLGLAPLIVDQVYRILIDLCRERHVTLLINEQSSQRVLRHASRIYVIRSGAVRLHDRAENLQDGEAISRAYFGFDSAPGTSGGVAA